MLSMGFKWKTRRAFLQILHITSLDASKIAKALESFVVSRQPDYRRLVGQRYKGAAVFSGCRSGVHIRMHIHAAHAMFIHCVCHRLQLASVQAAENVTQIEKIFGMMGNIEKLFNYSPKKLRPLRKCKQHSIYQN